MENKFFQDVVRDDEENERHLRDHGKLAPFITMEHYSFLEQTIQFSCIGLKVTHTKKEFFAQKILTFILFNRV